MGMMTVVLTCLLSLGGALPVQVAPRQGLSEAVFREVLHPDQLPEGRYVAVRQWHVVTGAAHMTGKAVPDPQATGGRAWEARLGAAIPGRAVVYGPYMDVPAGDYVAFVRLKAGEDVGAERLADLDAAVDYGQTICAVRELTGLDVPAARYARVPIAFRCPGGKLEIRVHWAGYAPVRVDTVELFRLEGGYPLPGVPRVPEAVPSGTPRDLDAPDEARSDSDIFPRSAAPADTLLVCDLTREPPDAQLCALVLQGLVNRKRPVLYCLYNETDSTWLNWMRRRGWIKKTRPVSSWMSLLPMFRSHVRGLVVTDPALPASKNVANMMAAVDSCLVVSPRLATRLATGKGVARFPVRADLRGRWKTSAEAYRWALAHLWPKLNHRLAACSYPDHLGLRDYLTQHRAFIFWISGPIDGAKPYANPTEEARVAEELLARMPPNCPIMSYPWAAKDVGIGEGPGVTLFAEFAKYLVGSINCTNLSVHSGIRLAALRPRTVPAPKLDSTRVYVTFIMSDGDNLPVLTVGNFPQLWRAPERGKVPIGWTVSPAASLLIPDIVEYYYTTATPNDAFLGAVSGVGYTYPDSYALRYRADIRQRVFDGFLEQTQKYMGLLGLRSLWIMNATQPEKIRRYAEKITPLEALYPDYGRRVSEYRDATYPTVRNVPVFHAVTGWTENATREQKIAQMVDQIRSMTPRERPAFLHAFIWNWGADLSVLPEVMHRLGPGYVAVRPDHLAVLFRQDLLRRHVLVRVPEQVMVVESYPLRLSAAIYGTSEEPTRLRVSVSGGLSEASVAPGEVLVSAGDTAAVTISGRPTADEIGMIVEGPFGTRRYTVPLRLLPLSEIGGHALPAATLRYVARYEGETLAHNSGTPLSDPAASGALAWKADSGTARQGYVVFGPYATLPKGHYLALFRLKGGGDAGMLGSVDTCVGGGNPITSSMDLAAEDLSTDEYRCLPLVFEHPGGQVETRVRWSGRGWLALDWVGIWQLEE